MPTYEYVCTQCGASAEIRASLAEKEKGLRVKCPKCGSTKMARAFGSFSVGGLFAPARAQGSCCPGGRGPCR